MEEIINIDGQQYKLESTTPLTQEQRTEVIKQLSKTGCTSRGTQTNISTLASNCPQTPIPLGTTKTFNCTASAGTGSYTYTLTIGSTVYTSSTGIGNSWSQSHTFNTAGTITPIHLRVVDTCTGTTLYAEDSCPSGIVVQTRTLATITLSGCESSIGIGATCQLNASCLDQFGTAFTCPSFTWTSSNTAIATVNSTGLVTGIANGTVTITATSGTISGTKSVTVQTSCTTPGCGFTVV